MLLQPLILTLPEGLDGFVVYCDVSRVKQGCVMMQHAKVIAYASTKLKVHQKELPNPWSWTGGSLCLPWKFGDTNSMVCMLIYSLIIRASNTCLTKRIWTFDEKDGLNYWWIMTWVYGTIRVKLIWLPMLLARLSMNSVAHVEDEKELIHAIWIMHFHYCIHVGLLGISSTLLMLASITFEDECSQGGIF